MKKREILRFLSGAARTGEEICAFFVGGSLTARPGIGKGIAAVTQLRRERWRKDPEGEQERRSYERIRRIIQSLKYDGLLETSSKQGRGATYSITRAGKKWLDASDLRSVPGPLSVAHYSVLPSDQVTIISYDVPHRLRHYRDWLRSRLLEMGFHFLQRSVFAGKITISEEFIDALSEYKLIDYIEIFEITKQGTLRSPKKGGRIKI